METIAIVVSAFGGIVVPVVGWIWRISVDKNFVDIKTQAEEDRQFFLKKIDEIKEIYVRKDLYEQATDFHKKEVDTKFENFLEKMRDQFRVVTDDIHDLKNLIINNFNNPRNPLSIPQS